MPISFIHTAPLRLLAPLLTVLLLASGCAKKERPAPPSRVTISPEEDIRPEWRNIARAPDITRIDALAARWADAISAIRPGEGMRTLRAAGDLLDPEVALERPEPSPGRYECRVWRLPEGSRAARGFVAYRPFTCYIGVEGPLLLFTKEEGSERPAGRIWPGDDKHLVFLGAMALGAEKSVPAYGDKDDRNLVGRVERVGAFRWRIVMPSPVAQSRLDVIEMVPLVAPMSRANP